MVKTDQQIADQIALRHIDQPSLTTSDDLLTSLIDQSQDRVAIDFKFYKRN